MKIQQQNEDQKNENKDTTAKWRTATNITKNLIAESFWLLKKWLQKYY